MEDWTIEKKWLMIHQDHQAELLASGGGNSQPYKAAHRKSMDVSRLSLDGSARFTGSPNLQKSSSSQRQSIQIQRTVPNFSPGDATELLDHVNNTYFDDSAADQNSPEYFLRKFLDPNLRSVTPKVAASLEVSLRTRPIT
jgi:hypothetical protein